MASLEQNAISLAAFITKNSPVVRKQAEDALRESAVSYFMAGNPGSSEAQQHHNQASNAIRIIRWLDEIDEVVNKNPLSPVKGSSGQDQNGQNAAPVGGPLQQTP